MPDVTLGRYEAEEGMLPPVCICCGAPATAFKAVNFSHQPDWTFFLLLIAVWPFALAALCFRKRMRALLPICEAHGNYWFRRRVLFILCLVLLLLLVSVGMFTLAAGNAGGALRLVRILLWLVGPLSLLVVLLVRTKMVRPLELTDEMIRFTGVSQGFVDAYSAERPSFGQAPAIAIDPAKAAQSS
ncbi:MAG TPA: hypothetical protein VK395_25985 [Gemmataceae bacterium]|nr:hypothetical protein [Gemmataceae bacterium]